MQIFQSNICRKTFWNISLLIMICYALLMISIPSGFASQVETSDAQLSVCLHESIHKLDPAVHRSRNIQIILKNMLDSLTTRDATMKVVPQLAESWSTLDDVNWEFKLKRGVKFHNNEELTSEDVKFSLERIFKEGGLEGTTSPRKSLLAPVVEVRIKDRYTVVIKTKHPWPILPLILSLHEIVPKKYVNQVGTQGFQAHPIGTGPFKFVKFEKDHRIIMERFNDYYGGSTAIPPVQKALLNSLAFEYVSSKARQIQMLKQNKCSIISHIDPASLPILKANQDIKVLSSSGTRSYFAEINCTKAPFNNPQIRRALNYAIDIDQIVKQALQGNGITLPTILLPHAIGYNSALKHYGYDPELAKQMLSEAKFNLNRNIQIYCNENELQFANFLSSFFNKIGIKSYINQVKFRKPLSLGPDAPWDIFLGSWGNSTLDPVGIILPKFYSNGRGNYSGYSNLIVDDLIDKAEKTTDFDNRETYYQKVQEILYEEAPMIFGYAKTEFYGVRKEINRFIPTSSGMMNMHDVFIETGSGR